MTVIEFAWAMLIIFGGIPCLWLIGAGVHEYFKNKEENNG